MLIEKITWLIIFLCFIIYAPKGGFGNNGIEPEDEAGFAVEEEKLVSHACPPSFCFHSGTCLTPEPNTFICACPVGYWGSRCQHAMGDQPCLGHLCANGAICDSDGFIKLRFGTLHYACKCQAGYSGPFCNMTKLHAMCYATSRCSGKAVRMSVVNRQCHCECKEHYTGENCDIPLPCARIHCEHKTRCVDGACNCTGTLYEGVHCQTVSMSKLRALGVNKNPCSYTKLKCNPLIKSTCSLTLTAQNIPVAYCNCTPPWTGDANCMKKFNACETTPFEKFCRLDYAGCNADGSMNDSTRCKNNGQCIETNVFRTGTSRTFTCKCPSQYMGPFCEFKNPCIKKDACHKDRDCLVVPAKDGAKVVKMCQCKKGSAGKFCRWKERGFGGDDRCEDNKCSSAGVCIPCERFSGICKTAEDHRRGYVCACDRSQSGTFCNSTVNPCDGNECRNHGTCEPVDPYTYRCLCVPGVTGLHCDVIEDMCKVRWPCREGDCFNDPDDEYGFSCACSWGYRGKQCELAAYKILGGIAVTRYVQVAFDSLWSSLSMPLLFFVLLRFMTAARIKRLKSKFAKWEPKRALADRFTRNIHMAHGRQDMDTEETDETDSNIETDCS